MIHIIKYLKTENLANETAAFYFEKPFGFVYRAGQFGDFTIINPIETDAEGNTRTFSLVSSPEENYITIATRMRDTAFKRNLKKFTPGTEIIFDAPMGIFTLDKNPERPAIFLAGGIGITPFRSIISDATEKKLEQKIYLFYSNKKPEDAPYLEELNSLEKLNPNFKMIAVMTQTVSSQTEWKGETGHINIELLNKYTANIINPIYYLAGPIGMVQALHKMLEDSGIAKRDIKIEEFTGY